jgi:hypothetical protein
MKRVALVLAAGFLGIGVAGCDYVKQSDESVHVGQLADWSAAVFDWQNRTYQTICEIAVIVDPNGDGQYDDIGAATRAYCSDETGQGNGGEPDPPPEWRRPG